ncbi:4832_t:CDS:2, partial [Cetraspora pellucida]
AMNIQTSRATGKSPYSLVFRQDPVKNFSIHEDLYQRNSYSSTSDQSKLLALNQEFLKSSVLSQSRSPTPNQEISLMLNQESTTLLQPESLTLHQSKPLILNQHRSSIINQEDNHPLKYSINDYICIAIPKIDCNAIDQSTLSCKVIEELPNETYRLQCKNGILDTTYNVNEIMSLELTEYEELEVCQDKINSV